MDKFSSKRVHVVTIALVSAGSIASFQNFGGIAPPTPSSSQVTHFDFADANSITTRPLDQQGPAPTLSEPLFAALTGETGPVHVAKGRAFYSTTSENTGISTAISSTIAPATQYSVGLDSTCDVATEPERCLRDNSFFVRLNPNARDPKIDNSIQDKAFFRFIDVDHPNALAINASAPATRYFTFDIKFDRFYERSKSWTMLMQAFQEGQGGGPAVFLEVVRSADATTPLFQQPLELKMWTRTNADQTLSQPIKRDGCPSAQVKVDRNRWYNLAMVMRPDLSRDPNTGEERGSAVLYIDGKEICRFKGNWGYRPTDPATPRGRMGIDLGVYRARTNSMQQVYFDNVKYGSSLHEVWSTGRSRVKFPLPVVPIE